MVAAPQANYLNLEPSKEENDKEEKTKKEEIQPENKILKPEKILLQNKEKEEKKRLSREEELEWIRKIQHFKGKIILSLFNSTSELFKLLFSYY